MVLHQKIFVLKSCHFIRKADQVFKTHSNACALAFEGGHNTSAAVVTGSLANTDLSEDVGL